MSNFVSWISLVDKNRPYREFRWRVLHRYLRLNKATILSGSEAIDWWQRFVVVAAKKREKRFYVFNSSNADCYKQIIPEIGNSDTGLRTVWINGIRHRAISDLAISTIKQIRDLDALIEKRRTAQDG